MNLQNKAQLHPSPSIQILFKSDMTHQLLHGKATMIVHTLLHDHYIASDINQKHSSSYDLYQHPPLGVRARQDLLFNLEQKT